MLKGRGKEVELIISDDYNVLIGTVDNKNPKSIYYKVSGWGEPLIDDDNIDYQKVINKLNKDIKKHTHSELDCDMFNCDITIIDLDMRKSGVCFNKKSFMCCEITLFQLNEHAITSNKIIDTSVELLSKILSSVFDKNEYFKFSKKKK